MKKIVVFVMLMMSVASVNAQRWSLTPETGMTAIRRNGGSDPNWGVRWKTGVGVEYQFKPSFSLKSGIYYTQRGYLEQWGGMGSLSGLGGYDPDVVYSKLNYKVNRHFLQVPLMANFSFRLADEVRLNVAIGPYVAYSLGNKEKYDYRVYKQVKGEAGGSYGQGWSDASFFHERWTHANPFGWGASLQIGLEVKRWVFNATYDISLGRESRWGDAGLKYQTFGLSIGYKFKMGK